MKPNSILQKTLLSCTLLSAFSSSGLELIKDDDYRATWGLGMKMRFYSVPYDQSVDPLISDNSRNKNYVPTLIFDSKYAFFNSTEAGLHLVNKPNFQINALARLESIDTSWELQNEKGGATGLFGGQIRFISADHLYFDTDLLVSSKKNPVVNNKLGWVYQTKNWRLEPSLNMQWNSADHNRHIYGLNEKDVGQGFVTKAMLETRFHVASSFYLTADIGTSLYSGNICNSHYMAECHQYELAIGFLFAAEPGYQTPIIALNESNQHYLRVSYGVGVDATFPKLLYFQGESKDIRWQDELTSIFYGFKFLDHLFSDAVDSYFTLGYLAHHAYGNEYVAAFKLYWNFYWPTHLRLGFAEGLSYTDEVSSTEITDIEVQNDMNSSEFANYLDVSFDMNLGELFDGSQLWRGLWFGYGLHHRSGLYRTAGQFGRIRGGVNYHTLYLQYEF
jgi:outer membrane protein